MKTLALASLALLTSASLAPKPKAQPITFSEGQLKCLLKYSQDTKSSVKVVGKASRGILIEEPVDYSKIGPRDFYCGTPHVVTITEKGSVTQTTDKDLKEVYGKK